MTSEQTNGEFMLRKFFAVIRAIANGEMNLSASIQIPDDYGRTVRIDEALAAAASHLEIPVPDDCLGTVQKACRRMGIEPPSDKINEIARAISDAVKAGKK